MPTLSSLFGQEAAIGALRKALEAEQLPGTYLFAGPAGVGKGALARAFAQAVACLTPRHAPVRRLRECESCRRMEAGTQPEIATIYPAGEQMQIWQFWDRDNKPQGILSHTLNFAPQIGKRRVYILEQAETLNESAANSLLKVLEEPPPYALFILLATHPARVLPDHCVPQSGDSPAPAPEPKTWRISARQRWRGTRPRRDAGRVCRRPHRAGRADGARCPRRRGDRARSGLCRATAGRPACSRPETRRTDAQTGRADQSPCRGRTRWRQ